MTSLPTSRSGQSPLEVATRAAKEAGAILVRRFSTKKEIRYKAGRANVVTDVDLLAEKQIIGILRSEYPDFGILTEESAPIAGDTPYTWIIDPLDGTNNYTFGVPYFCVNIALAKEEDVLLGLTYDPMRKDLFHAERGKGAFLGSRRISVSKRTSVKASMISFDMGYDSAKGRLVLDTIMSLWPGMHGLRLMGSAALGLACVAAGRVDLYLQPNLFPWDIAAGLVLVGEAGGIATNWDGTPATIHSTMVFAGNETLRNDFLQLVSKAGKPLASLI